MAIPPLNRLKVEVTGQRGGITAAAVQTAAQVASDAASAALSAASAAGFVGGVMYPTAAAGVAAVANNAYFTVAGDGTNTYAILYQKVSGAAVEKARYASKTYLDNNMMLASKFGAIKAKLARGEAVNICCLGDSTTAGVGTTGWAANSSVGNTAYAPPYAYPTVLQALLRQVTAATGVTVYNAGYSGFTTQSLYDNYNAIMGNMPALDMVILGTGLNDEQYDLSGYPASVELMVQRIIAGGSVPVLLSQDTILQTATGTGADARRDAKSSDQMAAVLEGIAKRYGLPYVDMQGALSAHWRVNEDGVIGAQATQTSDNLHGGDHVQAFKASYLVKTLIGRIASLDNSCPTNLAPWSDAAGPAPAAISRLSYTRVGGNLLFQTWTAGQAFMDAWVWNDGPRMACFARLIGANGVAGQRIKAEALSYSALPAVRDAPVLNDGVSLQQDYAEAEGAMFVAILPHGLNRIRWYAPTTGSGNAYPGFFQFVPNYKLDRVPGQFSIASSFAVNDYSRLLPIATGFNAYPRREDSDGGNLLSIGPDASHKTRMVIETNFAANTGMLFLDGKAWNPFGNFPAADTQAARVAAYIFRASDGYLVLGSVQYPPSSGFGGFDNVALSSAPLDWTSPVTMVVELWREGSGQRVKITRSDGTVLIDHTRPYSARPLPSGGCVGGFVGRDIAAPTMARYRVLSLEMSV